MGPRVVHVINSLQMGGAETMLARLVESADSPFEHVVLPLSGGGGVEERVRRAGALVPPLGIDGVAVAAAPFRLARRLRALAPDIIQGWLPQANLAVTVGAALARLHVPVVWNIRWTLYDFQSEQLHNRLLLRASGLLAKRATRIVFNAEVAVGQHARIGYPDESAVVIPNGFDLDALRPDPFARHDVRSELALPSSSCVVGMVARYHPMKDHALSLRAARRVLDLGVDAYFVYAGTTVDQGNGELMRLVDELHLRPRVRLLGERRDVARLYAAFDAYWMSSWAHGRGEGFPNAVAEAMACGVPCVATDVGEAPRIIGGTGIIVGAGDAATLGDAMASLLGEGSGQLGERGRAARQRILDSYSIAQIVGQYWALYRSVLDGWHRQQAARC